MKTLRVGEKSKELLDGRVKFFKKEKGFGFIIGVDDGKEYFVHASKVESDDDLVEGQTVKFRSLVAFKGLQAVDIQVIGGDQDETA